MARKQAVKGNLVRKEQIGGLNTSMLNAPMLSANNGHGGHACAQARKTAVKKAFALLTRKR